MNAVKGYKPKYHQLEGPIPNISELHDMGMADVLELSQRRQNLNTHFPFLTNQYYVSLMDKKDPKDPLRQMVVPTREELIKYENFQGNYDTSDEESNTKAPGFQHKYAPTAVGIVSNLCGSFCRFCFRKNKFMEHEAEFRKGLFPNEQAIRYLQEHKEINTLLLTGGDSLMLSNDTIRDILEILGDDSLSHITTIRFGSRMMIYQPKRFDDELGRIMQEFRKKTGKAVMIASHINHPNEVTDETAKALRVFHDHGIPVYNQTVLLKGINDNPEILLKLFNESLALNHVRPYYLFQDRPVAGSEQLEVRLDEGLRIFQQVMQGMTGPHKPRYAMSTVGGKMEIIGFHPDKKDVIVLKFHSAKDKAFTGKTVFYDISKNNPYWYYPEK